MSPMVVLLIAFTGTMFIGMPIVWALGLSSFLTLWTSGDIPILFLAQRMFTGAEKYTLLAIFFYLLAGSLLSGGGIARRLVKFANAWLGHIDGGLAVVAIVTCMFFAAVSGSSIATTAAVGTMLYPEMVAAGYPKSFAGALIVVAGTLGVIIPPSIPVVVYGTAMNTSVAKLLMAGIVPGVLGGGALIIYAFFFAKKHKIKAANVAGFDLKIALKETKNAFWALLMPVIILGGIYLGVFTPTESAAVAVLYGFIVSVFVFREIQIKDLGKIIIDATKSTAMVMLLLMSATLFAWLLTVNNVSVIFTNFVMSFISSRATFIFILELLLLFLGMFLDIGPIILIVGPLFYPVAMKYGIDPVHLGAVVVYTLALGQATPPFGNCLFAAVPITKQSVLELGKNSIPMVLAMVAVAFLLAYIPELTLFIPSHM